LIRQYRSVKYGFARPGTHFLGPGTAFGRRSGTIIQQLSVQLSHDQELFQDRIP
jgi:hypothetical protein